MNKRELLSTERPVFEEKRHKYFSPNTGEELTSVTTVYKDFFPGFNADDVLDEYYDGWQEKEDPRYFDKSREEIKEIWETTRDEAGDHGILVHDYIERYLLGDVDILDVDEVEDREARGKILKAVDWERKAEMLYSPEFVFPEEKIYSDELGIAGTIDLLFVTEEGELILIDWKTNSKLSTTGFYDRSTGETEKAYYPLDELEDSALSKYTMQLSTYAYVLENEYVVQGEPLQIKKLVLPWLKGDKIKEFEIPYEKELVEKVLKEFNREDE